MNVVRRFVPWELRGGKLYLPTASGGTIGFHKLIGAISLPTEGGRPASVGRQDINP